MITITATIKVQYDADPEHRAACRAAVLSVLENAIMNNDLTFGVNDPDDFNNVLDPAATFLDVTGEEVKSRG